MKGNAVLGDSIQTMVGPNHFILRFGLMRQVFRIQCNLAMKSGTNVRSEGVQANGWDRDRGTAIHHFRSRTYRQVVFRVRTDINTSIDLHEILYGSTFT